MKKILNYKDLKRLNINAIDAAIKNKGGEYRPTLFALRDSSLFEILLFLQIFPDVVKSLSGTRVFLGIPPKYEFLKSIYPYKEYLYILRISDDVEPYARKFGCIIDLSQLDIIPLHAEGDLIRTICDDILGTQFLLDGRFIKFNLKSRNEYSDIIGLSSVSPYPNSKAALSIKCESEIVEDIKDCSFNVKRFDIDFEEDTMNFDLAVPTPQPVMKPMVVSCRVNGNVLIDLDKVTKLIYDIADCKYFVGVESELMLLASMILGPDQCILLSKDLFFPTTFPELVNTVDVKDYQKGDISNMFNFLYQQDI